MNWYLQSGSNSEVVMSSRIAYVQEIVIARKKE